MSSSWSDEAKSWERRMTIRPIQASDLKTIVDVLRGSFAAVAERFGLTTENCPRNLAFCTAERIREDMARGLRYYLLEDAGTVCGCIAMEHPKPEVVYLERLAVVPEHRSRGFGQALVNHVLAQAKAAGAERVEIGIISEDTQLKQWYGRFGFVEFKTRTFEHLPFVVGFMGIQL